MPLCILLAAALLPAAALGACRGNYQFLRPGAPQTLDLSAYGRGWWGTFCLKLYTAPGHRFVLDCTGQGRYFDTYYDRYCSRNRFNFYPSGNSQDTPYYYCGQYNDLVLKTWGRLFYAEFVNDYSTNRFRGIYCDLRVESTSVAPTSVAPTTARPISTPETTPAPTAAPKCSCGAHNKDAPRIVNGRETGKNEYPSYAALYRVIRNTFSNRETRNLYCGGSLISDRYVLTASHCMAFPASEIQVVLGGHDMEQAEPSRISVGVEKIIKHENYNARTVKNDVALLKLKESVRFTSQISPVCLPPKHFTDNTYNRQGTVMGYGTTNYQGSGTTVLHDVDLKIESSSTCSGYPGNYRTLVTEDNICTHTHGKDACQGDSGGPLVFEKDGRLVQIGVVSWGIDCAKIDQPGVYAKVENFMDWIYRHTENTVCRE